MPEYPYSDTMYSGLDDSDVEDPDELYTTAAGLGLGDSSYRPQHSHQPSEEEAALSPSDGYFGRSEPQSREPATTAYPSDTYTPSHAQRQHRHQVPTNTVTSASVPRSSQVPHVPNVWVSDPSLEQGSTDKAREAQEERDQYQNRRLSDTADQDHLGAAIGTSSLSSPAAGASNIHSPFSLLNPQQPATSRRHTAASASSSPSTAAHRYTPSNASSSAAGQHHPRRIYSERSSLFGDAPPAYTPSPTSPTSNSSGGTFNNNYQTFSSTSPRAPGTSIMGRLSESESHGLLAGQTYNAIPQSMGGELDPNDDGHFEYPRPSGWRDRLREFSWSKHWKLVLLGILLAFVTLGFLMSSFLGVKNEASHFH